MEEIAVREATLKDLEDLLRFEQGVISAERPFDPTLKEGHILYYDLKDLISSPLSQLVVAESGGEIIGSGYGRIERAKPYLAHERFVYLGFMYTDPKHRGRGVNKKIIDALKQWALSQQVFEMRLEVYCGNELAQRAYEKVGFDKHMIEMRMGLGEESEARSKEVRS